MTANEERTQTRWPGWLIFAQAAVVILTAGIALASLLLFQGSDIGDLNLEVGTVAEQDVLAPTALTYDSEVLTRQQRELAAKSVPLVYTAPDTQIARQQVDSLRAALTFLNSVRLDPFANRETKLADISLLEGGAIPFETADAILLLNEDAWAAVQQETILVLQQVQKSTIRPQQIEDATRSIPALVSLTLPDDQAGVVVELVEIFISPNSFFSESLTEVQRQQAIDAVEPVVRTFISGETIVRRGQVLNESDVEALEQFGLLQNSDRNAYTINALLLTALSIGLTVIAYKRTAELEYSLAQRIFIACAFLIFLIFARILVIGHVVLPFIYPVAAFGFLVSALFSATFGFLLVIPLSILIAFGMPNFLELVVYYVFSTIFGVLMLGRSRRIISFFWAGVGSATIGGVLLISSRLPNTETDLIGFLTLAGAALVYGIASSGLTVLLQFFSAQLLGQTTNLQLMELSRPDHPLLRFLLLNAPGTYQHSLQVSNLAEQAAELIGADPLLTRIGALYHDIGKANNPLYFIENQIPGTPNMHDALSPKGSAQIIINHVTEGYELAKKHRLPRPIQAFILEHHGTMVTNYQYVRAIQEAGGDKSAVNQDEYRYPGPCPQSRETALVMLADGCEARTRAERPKTEQDLTKMIKETIDQRIAGHQLDDTAITPRDINLIVEVFTATLRGIYHPRLEYPKLDQQTTPSPSNRIDFLETDPSAGEAATRQSPIQEA